MALTLDRVKSSLDGPDIAAWPAKPDDDTSEGFPSLVDVDTHLGFTVVVIEPPTGLTFLALASGESHDHCILPHVEDQWSALFEQPYDKVARAKGIRLTDGILRDNSTLAVLNTVCLPVSAQVLNALPFPFWVWERGEGYFLTALEISPLA